MEKYVVLKISNQYLGDFLTYRASGYLAIDKVFNNYGEAIEYAVNKRTRIPDFMYFVWYVSGDEIDMLLEGRINNEINTCNFENTCRA